MTEKIIEFSEHISRRNSELIEVARGVSQLPRRVLLVDDVIDVRQVLAEVLRTLGITVLEATAPIEAIALFSQHHDSIDVLMVDIQMPEMDGWTLATKIASTQEQIRVLYISGGISTDEWERHPQRISDSFFLAKPFTVDDLKKTLKEMG
ncbi:response regulator [Terriglobus tenax]|uniref:response regulator n=1 Tax=Terriglobus tenax TaxID=1111115 RepID=UPI0021E0BDCC|nr:response regulator [Terriglobus tenax]